MTQFDSIYSTEGRNPTLATSDVTTNALRRIVTILLPGDAALAALSS